MAGSAEVGSLEFLQFDFFKEEVVIGANLHSVEVTDLHSVEVTGLRSVEATDLHSVEATDLRSEEATDLMEPLNGEVVDSVAALRGVEDHHVGFFF